MDVFFSYPFCISYDLGARTFSTLDFYAALQDDMTPASFGFFQACYDRSLRSFFQEKLSTILGFVVVSSRL
jgi:hypothetical protein